MASLETLNFLHIHLIKEISYDICKTCTDPRQQQIVLNFDDPRNCGCRCAVVEPLIIRLAEIEKALKVSAAFLS